MANLRGGVTERFLLQGESTFGFQLRTFSATAAAAFGLFRILMKTGHVRDADRYRDPSIKGSY